MAKVVKKIVKAVKPQKPKRGRPKGSKNKPKVEKPKITTRQIYNIVAETLQNNSDGEFDLPSVMVRYLEKSDPRSRLGLHREYWIPEGRPTKFYPPTSENAMVIFQNQASMILPAILSDGVPVREVILDPPFCKEHEV